MWEPVVVEIIDLETSSPIIIRSNSQGCDRFSCC